MVEIKLNFTSEENDYLTLTWVQCDCGCQSIGDSEVIIESNLLDDELSVEDRDEEINPMEVAMIMMDNLGVEFALVGIETDLLD